MNGAIRPFGSALLLGINHQEHTWLPPHHLSSRSINRIGFWGGAKGSRCQAGCWGHTASRERKGCVCARASVSVCVRLAPHTELPSPPRKVIQASDPFVVKLLQILIPSTFAFNHVNTTEIFFFPQKTFLVLLLRGNNPCDFFKTFAHLNNSTAAIYIL